MNVLIIIAIIVVLSAILLATNRSGPRVTTIVRRKAPDGEEDRNA